MNDYRLDHNCPPGSEIRFERNSDEEAVKEAKQILASLQSETPPDKKIDVRARLVRVIRIW